MVGVYKEVGIGPLRYWSGHGLKFASILVPGFMSSRLQFILTRAIFCSPTDETALSWGEKKTSALINVLVLDT